MPLLYRGQMYPGERKGGKGERREEGRGEKERKEERKPHCFSWLKFKQRNWDAYFSWVFVYLATRRTDYKKKKKEPVSKPEGRGGVSIKSCHTLDRSLLRQPKCKFLVFLPSLLVYKSKTPATCPLLAVLLEPLRNHPSPLPSIPLFLVTIHLSLSLRLTLPKDSNHHLPIAPLRRRGTGDGGKLGLSDFVPQDLV